MNMQPHHMREVPCKAEKESRLVSTHSVQPNNIQKREREREERKLITNLTLGHMTLSNPIFITETQVTLRSWAHVGKHGSIYEDKSAVHFGCLPCFNLYFSLNSFKAVNVFSKKQINYPGNYLLR